MSSTDFTEYAALAVGLLVIAAIVVSLVRLSRALDAIWPNAATRYGVHFEERDTGNMFTARKFEKLLEGTSDGVSLRVSSTRELIGNTRRTSTVLMARSLGPKSARFMCNITRAPGTTPAFHRVMTGDAAFDRVFILASDAPELVSTLVNSEARAALLRIPNTLFSKQLSLAYDSGNIILSAGDQPSKASELQGVIDALLAMARVRFTS